MNTTMRFIGTSKGIVNPHAIAWVRIGRTNANDTWVRLHFQTSDLEIIELTGREAESLIARLLPAWIAKAEPLADENF